MPGPSPQNSRRTEFSFLRETFRMGNSTTELAFGQHSMKQDCNPLKHAMSDPTVRGVVHLVEETKSYGQKGFRKRLVVLEQDNGRFTNYIPIEFTGDACDNADGLSEGQEVEFTYRLNGRRWQKDPSSEVKFFLNAEAVSYKVLGQGRDESSQVDPNDAFAEAAQDDDVPF